jgi:hypothetical protein
MAEAKESLPKQIGRRESIKNLGTVLGGLAVAGAGWSGLESIKKLLDLDPKSVEGWEEMMRVKRQDYYQTLEKIKTGEKFVWEEMGRTVHDYALSTINSIGNGRPPANVMPENLEGTEYFLLGNRWDRQEVVTNYQIGESGWFVNTWKGGKTMCPPVLPSEMKNAQLKMVRFFLDESWRVGDINIQKSLSEIMMKSLNRFKGLRKFINDREEMVKGDEVVIQEIKKILGADNDENWRMKQWEQNEITGINTGVRVDADRNDNEGSKISLKYTLSARFNKEMVSRLTGDDVDLLKVMPLEVTQYVVHRYRYDKDTKRCGQLPEVVYGHYIDAHDYRQVGGRKTLTSWQWSDHQRVMEKMVPVEPMGTMMVASLIS